MPSSAFMLSVVITIQRGVMHGSLLIIIKSRNPIIKRRLICSFLIKALLSSLKIFEYIFFFWNSNLGLYFIYIIILIRFLFLKKAISFKKMVIRWKLFYKKENRRRKCRAYLIYFPLFYESVPSAAFWAHPPFWFPVFTSCVASCLLLWNKWNKSGVASCFPPLPSASLYNSPLFNYHKNNYPDIV